MKIWAAILAFVGLGAHEPAPKPPAPPPTYLVRMAPVTDEKSVFATVESAYTVPARVRTGGTIVELKVRQGDAVTQGQVIATVGDAKLSLEINSYAAQVAAAQAQVAQAKLDFDRAQRLVGEGAIARNAYDQARTSYNVAQSNLKSIQAQRAVVREQQVQGEVRAPTAGRVITVPVTAGTVVMPGDVVATVAEQNFVLRLQIPERHAHFLKVGAPVRLDGSDLGLKGTPDGTITLIYPQVENGHVVADARVSGLQDYFVGQRVRVWVPAGTREAVRVPENLIVTRSGIDYARLWTQKNGALDVPVQRGMEIPGKTPQLEILSGLKLGDRLLKP
ncbi:MAG: efflux RND transporter periplasmic adaptor subunit [Alphaproteobacteria bacterium]|nr:efflux RND transporter periplasmic adaptor subunit [Alphaproteobacteria bacterium]